MVSLYIKEPLCALGIREGRWVEYYHVKLRPRLGLQPLQDIRPDKLVVFWAQTVLLKITMRPSEVSFGHIYAYYRSREALRGSNTQRTGVTEQIENALAPT